MTETQYPIPPLSRKMFYIPIVCFLFITAVCLIMYFYMPSVVKNDADKTYILTLYSLFSILIVACFVIIILKLINLYAQSFKSLQNTYETLFVEEQKLAIRQKKNESDSLENLTQRIQAIEDKLKDPQTTNQELANKLSITEAELKALKAKAEYLEKINERLTYK